MEIQTVDQKHSQNFSLANRKIFTQIRNVSSVEEIKNYLKVAFIIVGLKGDAVPSNESKAILLKFILDNYGDMYPPEIQEAFELLAQGKLEIPENQTHHYNDFSCAYFGRVMKAYRTHRNRELKKEIDSKQSKIKTIHMSNHAYLKSALFDKYEKIVNGMSYMSQFSKMDGYILYNKLDSIGMEISTEDERQTVWETVKADLDWFKPKKEKPKPTIGDAKNETKHRLFKSWIESCAFDEVNIMSLITLKLAE